MADLGLRSNGLKTLWTHWLHVWCEIPVSKTEWISRPDGGRGGGRMAAEVCDGGGSGGGAVQATHLFGAFSTLRHRPGNL